MAVSADIFTVDKVAQLKFRKFFRLGNCVQGIACGTEHSRNIPGTFLECSQTILAMVEQYSREGMIDPVVQIVASFPVAFGLADNFSHESCRRADQESARLRQNFHTFREQTIQFHSENFRQFPERSHQAVITYRKTAPDIEQLKRKSACVRFLHNRGRRRNRLDIVFKIGALTSDVKRQTFYRQSGIKRAGDQVDRFTRRCAEFAGQFDHGSGVRNPDAQCQTRMRCMLPDFHYFFEIVESDQWLILIQFLQRTAVLYGIRIYHLIPDKILSRFRRQIPDIFVYKIELCDRRHVETGVDGVKRSYDGRIRIRFYGVISLHSRKKAFKFGIVAADHIMIDNE